MSTELSQADLLSYMKAAIDLETQLMTQENALTECCALIQQRKPVLKLEASSGTRPQPFSSGKKYFSYVLAAISLFIAIAPFIAWILTRGLRGDSGMLITMCFIILLFGGLSISILFATKHEDTAANKAIEAYDKAKKSMDERNEKRKQDYDNALYECTASERSLRNAANPRIAKTRELLEKLYEKGYIYRKYCNLPALTSIYEYFVTGRCSELAGPHGAYNLYESELRADTIINQLNVVIANLEQIRNNQYMLYQQVSAIQENTRAITRELRTISGYTIAIAQMTALNTYYEGAALRQAEIEALYDL